MKMARGANMVQTLLEGKVDPNARTPRNEDTLYHSSDKTDPDLLQLAEYLAARSDATALE